jgi:hypothetical protein
MSTTDRAPVKHDDAADAGSRDDGGSAAPPVAEPPGEPEWMSRTPYRLLPRWARCRRSTLLAGLAGTLLGMLTLTLFQGVGAVDPPPIGLNQSLEAESDLILSVRESYLTSIAASEVARLGTPIPLENVRVDVQPGQRIVVIGDGQFMGIRAPAIALMTVGIADSQVRLRAESLHFGALQLPVDLQRMVADPINQQLAQMFNASQFVPIDVATSSDRLVVRLVNVSSPGGR